MIQLTVSDVLIYKVMENLPKIPGELISEMLTIFHDPGDHDISYPEPDWQRLLSIDGQQYPSTRQKRYPPPQSLSDWIGKNITSDYLYIHLGHTEAVAGQKLTYQGPHTDRTRKWALMYVLDPGGNNCQTSWYQQKNQPILRDNEDGFYMDDYNQLIKIGKIRLSAGDWCLFNAKVIHDVSGINTDRKLIVVALDYNKGNIEGV